MIYVSRAGFFLETDTPGNSSDIVQRYYHLVTQPGLPNSPSVKTVRVPCAGLSRRLPLCGQKPLITASVPVYYHHVWYGVVAMDFTFATLRRLLVEAVGDNPEGEYQLYDSRLTLLATSESPAVDVNHFDARELAQIAHAIESDSEGGIRLGSRFVSWERLDHFDGVILRVHTRMKGCAAISVASALCWHCFGRCSPRCCSSHGW